MRDSGLLILLLLFFFLFLFFFFLFHFPTTDPISPSTPSLCWSPRIFSTSITSSHCRINISDHGSPGRNIALLDESRNLPKNKWCRHGPCSLIASSEKYSPLMKTSMYARRQFLTVADIACTSSTQDRVGEEGEREAVRHSGPQDQARAERRRTTVCGTESNKRGSTGVEWRGTVSRGIELEKRGSARVEWRGTVGCGIKPEKRRA